MDELFPREIMREMLVVAPLGAFNVLARSCRWLRAFAASVAVDYANNAATVTSVNRHRTYTVLSELPNGVRHGASTVGVSGAIKIEVNYDRGRIDGLCNTVRPGYSRATFRLGGFVGLGAHVSVAYSTTCHVVYNRGTRLCNDLCSRMRNVPVTECTTDPPQYRHIPAPVLEWINVEGATPPKWDIDVLDHHTIAEAWFARHMTETPSHRALLEALCSWDESHIKFMREHLPGLFCARVIVESAGSSGNNGDRAST